MDKRAGSAYICKAGKWTHMRLDSGLKYEAGKHMFMRLGSRLEAGSGYEADSGYIYVAGQWI